MIRVFLLPPILHIKPEEGECYYEGDKQSEAANERGIK
jgi:hypothetical protein